VTFDEARAVADAVLFEGYALYPYRASAPKNQLRWQFGVLAPRPWSEAGGGDPWWQETHCLVEPAGDTVRVDGKLRFLHLVRRGPNPGAAAPAATPWDEGETEEVDFSFSFQAAGGGAPERPVRVDRTIAFRVPGGTEERDGVERRSWPLSAVVAVTAERCAAERPLWALRLRVENVATWTPPGAPRDEALRISLLGTHLLLGASGGAFLSLIDPPAWAAGAAAACRNVRTYPVLVGPPGRRDLVLSAPVILYDHPAVAPESPRDLFDATEIDEILTLRILTLTDDEKREVRATDPRLRALLEGVERLGPDEMARLHGATRELRPIQPPAPETVSVGGIAVGPGSRVRLCPGPRRSDAQDMFLAGLTATVEAVMRDIEDRPWLAVTVDDDPATELYRQQRRFLYFYPDELEPLP
jgi:hypothetical protein